MSRRLLNPRQRLDHECLDDAVAFSVNFLGFGRVTIEWRGIGKREPHLGFFDLGMQECRHQVSQPVSGRPGLALSLRATNGQPVRVGLIGAGKFGSMVLAQAQRIAGLHMVAIADLDVGKAKEPLQRVGWPKDSYAATSCGDVIKTGGIFVTDVVKALLECGEIKCVIEATGHPIAGTRHTLGAIESRKHVVMVNVEADVMVGPILAEKARAAGLSISWPTATSRR